MEFLAIKNGVIGLNVTLVINFFSNELSKEVVISNESKYFRLGTDGTSGDWQIKSLFTKYVLCRNNLLLTLRFFR